MGPAQADQAAQSARRAHSLVRLLLCISPNCARAFCRVWSVKYNRFHDQLILSAGTDRFALSRNRSTSYVSLRSLCSAVNLWSIVSTSSAPLGELEDPANEKDGDKLIKTYDEHEDRCVIFGSALQALTVGFAPCSVCTASRGAAATPGFSRRFRTTGGWVLFCALRSCF